MPSVQQTAAFCGLRPVANAFGASVGADVEPGHRLAGSRGELADDAVHRRRLGLGDRVGVHGADGELVAVPVAVEGGRDADEREEPDEASPTDEGTDAEQEGPDAAEEGGRLEPVEVLVHVG